MNNFLEGNMIKSILKTVAALYLLPLLLGSTAVAQINFPTQSSYKYLKGSGAVNLSSNWVNSDFNDTDWLTGNAPFRYGDGAGGTELTDMQGNYSTLYMRSKFTVQQVALVKELTITADWDDGFVLFINGKEVLSRMAPTVISYDALSSAQHEFGVVETIKISTKDLALIDGQNTIAIFGCNTSLTESSDFYFDMSITAFASLPTGTDLPELIDSVGVTYSKPSGFYNANFNLTISSPVSDAKVVYTLDGSNPQTSATRIIGTKTTEVAINPDSKTNRGTTPAVVVRASIIKDGFMASKPKVHTFIFIENVKTQTQPGWDWPTGNVNDQQIDYDIDRNVVTNSKYIDLIDDALLDIPTISLVTDNANLFNADSGIYVNALMQGEEWERQSSVELINPDGTEGFSINAGLRIRGGWSRHGNYPKHAFRLFFREEYGASKLQYPLFGDEGVDHFDKIDLRCEQNYSWANDGGEHNTFLRELFLRDAQGETGSPYTRSRYYHLYLNGMYWGLFQTQERSEARWASDYFGGKTDDWDVLKRGGVDNGNIEATDGNLDKWKEVWNITQTGYAENKNYFKLEGKDADGMPLKNSEKLVDIDNLIDYMINIFYSGNFDAPVNIWSNNNSPNNLYMIKNREDKSQGFIFLIHDAEHSLMAVTAGHEATVGLEENRVNLAYRADGYQMQNPGFDQFHTQWLHHRLTANEEYRLRFADKAYKRLSGTGIFTEDANNERMNKRAAQIEMAVIAESARWGDARTWGDPAFTKEDWEKELSVLSNDYFPYRSQIVKEQLYEYDLYPSVSAPSIKMDGAEIWDEQVFTNSAISLTFTATSGEIYYTSNGSDPRLLGGDLSPKAIKIETGSVVSIPQSAIIKARVFKNNKWSALKEISIISKQTDFSKFKVTELHYHPLDKIVGVDTVEGSDYEFIEFKNIGTESAINLSGLVIDSAINYTFPENTLLAPQQFYVVAAKPQKFYERYGMLASGNFSNSFSNGGEQVLIFDSKGAVVLDFTYDDKAPWPEAPDGEGNSLVSQQFDPTGDPNSYDYWNVSASINGSPFYDDAIGASINDAFADNISDAFQLYPNPSNNEVNLKYIGFGDGNFKLNLYDLSGSLIFSQTYYGSANISLASFNIGYGVYLLKIESGNQTETRKVVYTPY